MGTQSRRIAVAVSLAAAVLSLASCGSKAKEASDAPVAEIDGTINTGTFETTATLDCADKKSLNVGGSKNTLTVTGTCASVIIGGDDNKVTFDGVDRELVVAGLNNTVTYRQGDPSIQDLGTGNSITKG